MAAQVVPFLRPRMRPLSQDWTEQERAEFFRVVDALGRSGVLLDLETGLTDEGEPWAVFCIPESGDPVVHIARLEGCYVLAATTMTSPARGSDLRLLVQQALDDVPAAVLPKATNQCDGSLHFHPSALLLILVATSWFHSAQAAEPGSRAPISLSGNEQDRFVCNTLEILPQAVTPSPKPAADNTDAEAQDGTENVSSTLSAQRFQQAISFAVGLLLLNATAVALMTPSLSSQAGAVLEAAEAVHASGTQTPTVDQDQLPLIGEPHRHALTRARVTPLDEPIAAEDEVAAPELVSPPTAGPPATLTSVGHAATPPVQVGAPPLPAAWIAGHHDADRQIVWALGHADLSWGEEDGLPVPQWLGPVKTPVPSVALTEPAAQSATAYSVSSPISQLQPLPLPAAPSEALMLWSAVVPGKAVVSVDALPAALERKLAALISTADIPLEHVAAAIADADDGSAPTTVFEPAAEEIVMAELAKPASVLAPAFLVESVAPAAEMPPHRAELETVAPVGASTTMPPLAAAPAKPVLYSHSGTEGGQAQEVALADGLLHLHQFTASTAHYITVATANSLVLIDEAVLANTRLPHSFSSLQMPDGSEITWVQAVGIAPELWSV